MPNHPNQAAVNTPDRAPEHAPHPDLSLAPTDASPQQPPEPTSHRTPISQSFLEQAKHQLPRTTLTQGTLALSNQLAPPLEGAEEQDESQPPTRPALRLLPEVHEDPTDPAQPPAEPSPADTPPLGLADHVTSIEVTVRLLDPPPQPTSANPATAEPAAQTAGLQTTGAEAESSGRSGVGVVRRAAGLPDARAWGSRLAQAVAEVLAGDRPLSQLVRWTDAVVYMDLNRRVRVLGLTTTATHRGAKERSAIRSVRVSQPAERVAEIAAHVRYGNRSRAMALRLEVHRGRWICTALELG
ncbi:hypothetical protein EV643_103112 [Kribbella sp. VKM Ac-2527]|uniref:Uncharacterized protein n=1 Tax=Kribbella caucasensis TaxID=2512215 RepID=A0A4R6KLW3_9ACTN|nr:Rv3235 family protein [Kribbella sp. VKM Ac-2527]TDO51375.1 hypothetical protein EV643_103112 [Kribbella sp. VKM Ac-2527]